MALEDFNIERWDYMKVLRSHWLEVERALRNSITQFTILFLFAELLSAGAVSGIQFLGVEIKDVGFLHRVVTLLLAVISYQATYWLLRSIYAADAWTAVRYELREIKSRHIADIDDIAPNSAITRFEIREPDLPWLYTIGARFPLFLVPLILDAAVIRAIYLLFSQYGPSDPWNWVVTIPTIILMFYSTVDSYWNFYKLSEPRSLR